MGKSLGEIQNMDHHMTGVNTNIWDPVVGPVEGSIGHLTFHIMKHQQADKISNMFVHTLTARQ